MWASGHYGYLSDYLVWCLIPVSLGLHVYCFFRSIRGRPRRWWHLATGNTLVTLFFLCVVALVAESYLRFVSTATDTFGVTLTSKRWFAVYPERNSLYFRDVEWSKEKPQGVRRIAFLGDSFTYGWGIDDRADRFTDRIQRAFRAGGSPRVEVMNAAWVGSDTAKQIEIAGRLLDDYAVDEIVLCHLPNDIEKLIPPPEGENPLEAIEPRAVNVESSFLLNTLYYSIIAPRLVRTNYFAWLADGYADQAVWRLQVQRFVALIERCRSRGVRLRVVLLPFVRTPGTAFDTARVHAKVAEVFRSRGVDVADLTGVLAGKDPKSLVVSAYDLHPNATAHRLFAEAIWRAFYEAD